MNALLWSWRYILFEVMLSFDKKQVRISLFTGIIIFFIKDYFTFIIF